MNIGYARVSTEDQKLDLQIQALKQRGCTKIYSDHGISGQDFHRPGLDALTKVLKPGDTLMVWRLDRLGRSLMHLVRLVDELGRRGIHFLSLCENIDTSSPGGRLIFHMMAALAEFERSLISERTRAGMAAARNLGRHVGRKPILSDEELLCAAHALESGEATIFDLAKAHGLAPHSLRRMIRNRVEKRRDAIQTLTISVGGKQQA
ncbi:MULTISPECIES: recombinase family protein [Rhizobium]|uniref:DNA resolvase n=1 Tax=Rhizobium wuzhouense TaxID=1986026 RepID=A0ABX5NPK6_9HYPH|nr:MULTISPECIES: recombinase family protein [Rhizobium]PYB71682.1 DNA resolvase [Rhizobium wuzhouense]RKE79214.1 resolvase-like protein [Rhizobium sp. AG855]